MRRSPLPTIIAGVAALAAAVISFQLLAKHLSGQPAPAWFELGCSDKAGGAGCGKVLVSPYGYWPAKVDGEPADTKHIPVAFFGLTYYSVVLVWLIGIGRPSHSRRWLQLLPLGFVALGVCASAYFVYVMGFVIHEWCVWCCATHVLNVIIAAMLALMWPSRETTGTIAAKGTAPETTAPREPHPSFRLTLVTLAMALVLALFLRLNLDRAELYGVAANAKRNFDDCVDAVKRVQGDSLKLFTNWTLAEKREITVRPDDPARGGGRSDTPTLDLIVFSDFECAGCQRFAFLSEQRIVPLFDGNLRVVFKHHPFDAVCNNRVSTSMHPQACKAAAIAEAVRVVGGNEAFWRAHDYMFKHRDALEKETLDLEGLVAAAGVDGEQFSQAISSPDVRKRIGEDIALAATLVVDATPAIYVEGKRVDGLAWPEIGFWDKLAEHYWTQIAKKPRPPQTRVQPQRSAQPAKPATQDTPGRKAVP